MRYPLLHNVLLTFLLFVRCRDMAPAREDDLQRPKHVAIFT